MKAAARCCTLTSARCIGRYRYPIIIFIVFSQIYFLFQYWFGDLEKADKFSQHFSSPVEFINLPESNDGRYKLWRFIWTSFGNVERKNKNGVNSIGIATQCSLKNMKDLLVLMSSSWDGPVSLTIFITGNEWNLFKKYLRYLVDCHQEIAVRVDFHVVFPLSNPPSQQQLDVGDTNLSQEDICSSSIHSDLHAMNYMHYHVPYPVNVLRNVAVSNLDTKFVLVLDVDMVPSFKLSDVSTSRMLNNTAELNALVIPAFEVREGRSIPQIKSEVIGLWEQGDVRPFYEKVCWKCQKYTDYEHWKSDIASNHNSNSYRVDWHDPWEPFYIALKEHVKYDERFEQYGFNRISQLCDLHMAGFNFHVSYKHFLIHVGFKDKNNFHKSKDVENERNKIVYRKIKKEMLMKYPDSRRHC